MKQQIAERIRAYHEKRIACPFWVQKPTAWMAIFSDIRAAWKAEQITWAEREELMNALGVD